MLKKILIVPIATLALALPLMSMGVQRLAPAVRQKATLKKELNLTPEQKSQWKAIVQSNRTQRQTIGQDARQKAQSLHSLRARNNPNPTDVGNAVLALKQARSQAREMRQQTVEKLKGTLTPDQLKTFEEIQAKRKG
jgi:Spy/CpxP family protein refolding chaperone